MYCVRCAHTAVDYLTAAVGGDLAGGGAVGAEVEGRIPLVLGVVLQAMVHACLELLVTGSGWRPERNESNGELYHFKC